MLMYTRVWIPIGQQQLCSVLTILTWVRYMFDAPGMHHLQLYWQLSAEGK